MTDIDYEKEYNNVAITLRAAQCWILKHTGSIPTKKAVILNMFDMLSDSSSGASRLFSSSDLVVIANMLDEARLAVEKKNANN